MSGIEDPQNASEQDDIQEETTETAEVSNEVASSIEESDSPELSERLSTKGSEEEQEEVKKKEREEIKEEKQKETPSREETQKEETSDSAELATVTRSASSDDGVLVPVSGVVARQAESGEPRVGVPAASIVGDKDGQQRRVSSGPSAAVGEWNSLPVLVERLREALELSLAAGCRRGSGDEPAATSLAEPGVGVGAESGGDRSRARCSMEQALLGGSCDHDDPEPKKDELKFLEDLLLSDIQTALSRLRETLERTDVATLAKHGGVSDSTSKLHLLRLVSILLSRLQVPEEESTNGDNSRTIDITPPGRRRRAVRHTIGVSAEEIAHARRQLEESSADLARLSDQVSAQRRELLLPAHNTTNSERYVEEIHDKYTKDVINQRQSLRDKNKDSRGETGVYRSLVPVLNGYGDRPVTTGTVSETVHQTRRRGSIDSYQEKESDDEETAIRKANDEQSRVTKLAATLRQRAELVSASRCNNGNNKFTAKKSKIKRANTIDIPSYLKLQAGNLGYDNSGCVLLRRPINVGDKVTSNASNLAVPSFHPRTENDKKFLALINRNNEAQTYNAAPAFIKPFGHTKATDMSSLANENWNSRFSNIKTAFDKPSTANDANKLSPKLQSPKLQSPKLQSPKLQPAKRFPSAPQTPPQMTSKKTSTGGTTHNGFPFANANVSKADAGFRHAPSSLFRKIEKPQTPKSPPSYHYQRDNAPPPGNTLREKARIMFDRDSNAQSRLSSRFNANESSQKSFPRPPWIEHDRNEVKSSNMVTENGRLDYRQFCKQFAPFIGKNAVPETKKSQNLGGSRKRDEQSNVRCENFAPSNEKFGIVDGKISFKMLPEKGLQMQQYRSSEQRHESDEPVRDKFDLHSEKDTFEPMYNDKDLFGTAFARDPLIDATFKGNSSVAIQTGVNDDDYPEEARVFCVAPKVSRGPPSAYSNASVQTYESEPKEQWTSRYEHNDANPILNSSHRSTEDPRHFVLDHNRNYHADVTTDVTPRNDILSLANKNICDFVKENTVPTSNPTENVSFQAISGYHSPEQRERVFQTNPQYEDYISPKPAIDNRLQIHQNYSLDLLDVKSNGDPFENQISNVPPEIDKEDFPYTSDGTLPEEQNIQNQDISADAGVVTRYTCAIATVASTDTPETRLDGARPESEASSSSPSQLWSHPKPTNDETTTTEDEIRRHNMLQQSLVRRLQNERTMLNDHHIPIFNQPVSNQSDNFNRPSNINQFNDFNQPLKFQPPEAPKRLEPPRKKLESSRRLELPRKSEPPKRLEPPKKLEPLRRSEPPRKLEPPRRLEPPIVTGLLSVSPSSGFGAMNRVTALREQYEQPSSQSKPVQKERSPISNGASNAIDSSDEYLVSCASKPFRSIVLSKSESWHQLALSKSHHSSPRPSQSGLSPQPLLTAASYLPKPPKPKSPSSFKMKKQYEASSSSDSVKRMEDKIRRYFDNPINDNVAETKGRRFSSRDLARKGLVGLSRSRTMPGICDEKLSLLIPTTPSQISVSLNSAEVDKVFDDIFEEATKADDHRF